jgi:hypothetical protein
MRNQSVASDIRWFMRQRSQSTTTIYNVAWFDGKLWKPIELKSRSLKAVRKFARKYPPCVISKTVTKEFHSYVK